MPCSSKSNSAVWWFAPEPSSSFWIPVKVMTPGQSFKYMFMLSEAIHGVAAVSASSPRYFFTAFLAIWLHTALLSHSNSGFGMRMIS